MHACGAGQTRARFFFLARGVAPITRPGQRQHRGRTIMSLDCVCNADVAAGADWARIGSGLVVVAASGHIA